MTMNILFIAIASLSALSATEGNAIYFSNDTIDVSEETQSIQCHLIVLKMLYKRIPLQMLSSKSTSSRIRSY